MPGKMARRKPQRPASPLAAIKLAALAEVTILELWGCLWDSWARRLVDLGSFGALQPIVGWWLFMSLGQLARTWMGSKDLVL